MTDQKTADTVVSDDTSEVPASEIPASEIIVARRLHPAA
jgi:hypothetical protein